MATVTIEDAAPEGPARQVVKKTLAERMVTLPDGRTMHYRQLRTLERMDLNALAGPQNAVNLAWMADASLAFSVTRIDGEAVAKPTSIMQLRALIQRIGDDAMEALAADAMTMDDAEKPGEVAARAGE